MCRFSKEEIRILIPILGISNIPWRNCLNPSPELAICILLYRLSVSGSPLKDEIKVFGHSRSYISLVFNDILVYLCSRFRGLLFWDNKRLTLTKISEYAEAIERIVGGRGVWGWIDGTMCPICQPGENQGQ